MTWARLPTWHVPPCVGTGGPWVRDGDLGAAGHPGQATRISLRPRPGGPGSLAQALGLRFTQGGRWGQR